MHVPTRLLPPLVPQAPCARAQHRRRDHSAGGRPAAIYLHALPGRPAVQRLPSPGRQPGTPLLTACLLAVCWPQVATNGNREYYKRRQHVPEDAASPEDAAQMAAAYRRVLKHVPEPQRAERWAGCRQCTAPQPGLCKCARAVPVCRALWAPTRAEEARAAGDWRSPPAAGPTAGGRCPCPAASPSSATAPGWSLQSAGRRSSSSAPPSPTSPAWRAAAWRAPTSSAAW
jgi:hypothetical protein